MDYNIQYNNLIYVILMHYIDMYTSTIVNITTACNIYNNVNELCLIRYYKIRIFNFS